MTPAQQGQRPGAALKPHPHVGPDGWARTGGRRPWHAPALVPALQSCARAPHEETASGAHAATLSAPPPPLPWRAGERGFPFFVRDFLVSLRSRSFLPHELLSLVLSFASCRLTVIVRDE